MSRKVLIIAAVVSMLLATSVAAALAAPLEAGNAAPVPVDAGPAPSSDVTVWTLRIQPEGGCENGGAGGCPVTG